MGGAQKYRYEILYNFDNYFTFTLNIVQDRAISSSLYEQTIPRHEKPGTGGPGWAPCRASARAGSLRDLC